MKLRLILCACVCFALCACKNEQLITLLRAPSELARLEITAYIDDFALAGGAAMEPGFTGSVFNYTVYVAKDANRFGVNAFIDGNGTIDILCAEDRETGADYDFLDDEKTIILTIQREYMETAEYRVTVVREGFTPTATGVEIHVTPGIASFFIGSGVLPVLEIKANLPPAGGSLSYQWFMNTENSNRGGTRIGGATGTTYQLRVVETMIVRTVYYYAEITNTIGGQTGVTESNPCAITFINKFERLNERSLEMVKIPEGSIEAVQWNYGAWETPGFLMGENLVTWELWKLIFDHAESGNYYFARKGNQGARSASTGVDATHANPQPVGNVLHPVTMIDWRNAVVWCNAYSEMDGLEPVYVDANGAPLRDSRDMVELLVDETRMEGKNGYRLPTSQEWNYAKRGADAYNPRWNYPYSGVNTVSEFRNYLWSYNYTDPNPDPEETNEVGWSYPNHNAIGLYDMMGLAYQLTFDRRAFGGDFAFRTYEANLDTGRDVNPNVTTINTTGGYIGLRVVRAEEKE